MWDTDIALHAGDGLRNLENSTMNDYFQISEQNMMIGFNNRVDLLKKLGASLLNQTDTFGPHGRPGHLVGMSEPEAESTRQTVSK